ncbi:hypothetical protein HHL22_17170 [Hymenobacter sp. RP-2-7]|uniref:Uncharacterized protein n=1 Tax=Hymenobacter polaris TaxID=2682546 RepID=A0A7Y0AGN5_9BACT|nr:hypothetical protein [Hymenobacter polaris]NML66939.1 hypothetical protein [Hymenobacter polaris]
MTGTLAQQLSLISYGNHLLKTGELTADYYPANPAFTFCNRVDFLYLPLGANTTETLAAPDPLTWLRQLRQQGYQRLSLCYRPSAGNQLNTPDYKLAGFIGGGGDWLLEVASGPQADYWANRWEVTQPNDPQQLIWGVSYGRVAARQPLAAARPPLPAAKAALAQALTEIQAFATAQQLDNWATIFGKALALLDSPEPANGVYHNLLVTAEHSLAARQLIFAASQAWVFGGMGSWNDLVFEDEASNQRYETLSGQLYAQVNQAIISGINAPGS